MRVKLTAKHPRPASPSRTPVRSGSPSARKATRPAPSERPAPAEKTAVPRTGAKAAAPRRDGFSGTAAKAPTKAPLARTGARRSEEAPRGAPRARPTDRGSDEAPRSAPRARPTDRRGEDAPRSAPRARPTDRRGEDAPRSAPRARPTDRRSDDAPRGAPRARPTDRRSDDAPRSAPRARPTDRRSDDAPRSAPRARPTDRRSDDAPRSAPRARPTDRRSDDAPRRAPRARPTDRRGDDSPRGAARATSTRDARPPRERAPHAGEEQRARPTARAPGGDRPSSGTDRRFTRGGANEDRPRGDRPARSGATPGRPAREPAAGAGSARKTTRPPSGKYGDTATGKAPRSRAEVGTGKAAAPLRIAKPVKAGPTGGPADDDSRTPSRPHADDGLVRLSKRMSELGLCSRREADEWIENGWVRVDGERIDTLGSRVRPDQHIEVTRDAQAAQSRQVTILLHKPVGYVSGQAEEGYQPAITLITAANRWEGDRATTRFAPSHLRALAPAGRLDIDSTGLLVLTQDGRIAKQLIGEHSSVEKEYLVRVTYGEHANNVAEHFPADQLALLRFGLSLDGVALKAAKVSWQNGEQLRFVLREGKKRQIRRMCELVGLYVVGLKRVRMGSVVLGALPQGKWRYLLPNEAF